ncbi:hypothetical protein O4H52_13960 [Sphingomonadaceae bacterium G21617-S1]|nr:hypothetical protein [Sphingomonadaceae bacterium G21617-S1]
MPKKQPGMTPEEQSEKFKQAVRDAVADGTLSPTEADAAFERLIAKVEIPKPR